MKILAFGDSHGDKNSFDEIIKNSTKVDVVICTGDISLWGENEEKWIKYLAEKINKPIIMTYGNHEYEKEIKKLCKKYKLLFLHKKSIKKGCSRFFGYGGGGFSEKNENFEKTAEQFYKTVKKDEKIIIVTHGPPYGTKIDFIEGIGHTGCKSMRKILDEKKPDVWICGHIHETEGEVEVVGKTVIVNPGPFGREIKI